MEIKSKEPVKGKDKRDPRAGLYWRWVMLISMFKTKIHRATVTQAELNYVGSVTIDRDLIDAAGLRVYEQVDVLDINNGARFTTYVIAGERGSGVVCLNGACARLAAVGDLVIVVSYAQMTSEEADRHRPRSVHVDARNRITDVVDEMLRESPCGILV